VLSKRNLLVYAVLKALLGVKVALELDYVLSHENVFVNGDTATCILNRFNRWK
jgi:hypothetical protein